MGCCVDPGHHKGLGMPTQRTDKKWEVVVLGIVAVVFLVVALVIGTEITDHTPGHTNSTPLISMLVALVPLTITSLLALLRTNDNRHAVQESRQVVEETKAVAEQTQKDLKNGVLTANMRQAIRAIAREDGITIDTTSETPNASTDAHPAKAIDPRNGDIAGAPGHKG